MINEHIFDLNVSFGNYSHLSQISLSDEDTAQLYRLTFGLEKDASVDLDKITTEECCNMEQALALCMLEAFENNDAMLDPIYEWFGETA